MPIFKNLFKFSERSEITDLLTLTDWKGASVKTIDDSEKIKARYPVNNSYGGISGRNIRQICVSGIGYKRQVLICYFV